MANITSNSINLLESNRTFDIRPVEPQRALNALLRNTNYTELREDLNFSNAEIVKLKSALDIEKKRTEKLYDIVEKMQNQLKMVLEI